MTLPDPGGDSASPFHTHCLAIGRSCQDHNEVIDHYLKEIEILMKGRIVYCGETGKCIQIQMGLLAYLADRPERFSLMHINCNRTYGKRQH